MNKFIPQAQIIALGLGVVLLLTGVIWLAADTQPAASVPVKQPTVSLPPDAFSDDPRLQQAVQNLLQTQQPQQQQDNAGSQLQAGAGNLQAGQ